MKATVKLFAAGLLLASADSALADVRYVDVNSTNATPPYSSWATAATNIQDAVDAAVAGDEIVVTNGIYATGGRAVDGFTTNRVLVDKPLTLRSVNGPQFTIIDGGRSNRCVNLTNGASLSGFTLTNGFALEGGGLWCESTNAVVSNCVVSGNYLASGSGRGGGADGDGVNNYGEWLAGSDPTNPFSFPPLLTLIPYGANVILTWPTNAVGFTLQSTTNLGSSAVWTTNSPGPVIIGGQNVVINPITGPQQFYRLRH